MLFTPSAALLLFTAGLGVCSSLSATGARRLCPLGLLPSVSSPPRPNTTSRYSPSSHWCMVVCQRTRERFLCDTLGCGRRPLHLTLGFHTGFLVGVGKITWAEGNPPPPPSPRGSLEYAPPRTFLKFTCSEVTSGSPKMLQINY